MGKAGTQPLITDNPLDARNRRITLILLKEDITNPLPYGEVDGKSFDEEILEEEVPVMPVNPYHRTPGAVEFP